MSTINLSKGSVINLSKAAEQEAPTVLFGVNWGKIKQGLLGMSSKEVDLDATAVAFDANGNVTEKVSFQGLVSNAMRHSGDDRSGDSSQDDDDNETITIDFSKFNDSVKAVVLFVNSYDGTLFDKIPYAGVRLYEGSVNNPTKVYAKMDVANDSSFKGATTMILGAMVREGGAWEFKAIGAPVNGITRIEPTITLIKQKFQEEIL